MQVSAYNIVKNFGIDALKTFWTIDNENEIQRCRQDWKDAHVKTICLKSFNDGNSSFEVIGNLDALTVHRTDNNCDVTKEYAVDLVQALFERNAKRDLFGITYIDMVGILALIQKA